jgi:excisionase family DNA binding protein
MVDCFQAFALCVQTLIEMDEDRAASSSRMLSPKDLAERWGRSGRHVRGLCASGKIKAVKEGRDWLITEPAVAAYLRKLGVR